MRFPLKASVELEINQRCNKTGSGKREPKMKNADIKLTKPCNVL
jgi:hypothetical protein